MSQSYYKDLSKIILSRQSICYIHTWEEERVVKILETIAEKQFSKPLKLYSWSVTEGLKENGSVVKNKDNKSILDPIEFLDFALRIDGSAIFVAVDLPQVIQENSVVRRKLRDIYNSFKSNYKILFLIANQVSIPQELSKEMGVYNFPFPDYAEIRQVFESVVKEYKEKKNIKVALSEEEIDGFVRGAMGLTLDEALKAYNKAFLNETRITRELISKVLIEKKFLIDKAPGLVYVTETHSLAQVGGLEILKKWLGERIRCFTPEAKKYRIVPPKGLLLTGIAGCGKSFIVKGIAGLWDMPLIRLDMNQIYSMGSAGLNFENALRTVEAIAPSLLWIDEIEKAIGPGSRQGDEASRIFGTFLTWMQEKVLPVFVVATANNIDLLPPEMLRKGRFDDIFFVDLPTRAERESIFRLHMLRRNLEPSDYDLQSITVSTQGFNGAEVEQVVVASLFRAFMRNEKPNQEDFYQVISKTIPLSVTMHEEIKEMKRWANQRAVFAGVGTAGED